MKGADLINDNGEVVFEVNEGQIHDLNLKSGDIVEAISVSDGLNEAEVLRVVGYRKLRSRDYDKIEDFRAFIAEAGLETGGTGAKVRPVVSCKGTTCQYGLFDTYSLSRKVHDRFYKGYETVKLPHKFKIAVGGCPNN